MFLAVDRPFVDGEGRFFSIASASVGCANGVWMRSSVVIFFWIARADCAISSEA